MELIFGTLIFVSMDIISIEYMYGNPSLSKLCRKNPIRNVVGWYKMSSMVYFEFWLSWFWFGRKFLLKRANMAISVFWLIPLCLGEGVLA